MRILWKVVSVGSAVYPITAFLTYWQEDTHMMLAAYEAPDIDFGWRETPVGTNFSIIILYVSILLHVVFRFILIVLIFLSFRNFPQVSIG